MRLESLPMYLIMGAIILFMIFITFDLLEEVKATKNCKTKYPNAEFCGFVKSGVECGFQCKELDLEFFHYDKGGVFATDKCSCKDTIKNEVVQLY